jgi:Domain of unknown function (DUF927)
MEAQPFTLKAEGRFKTIQVEDEGAGPKAKGEKTPKKSIDVWLCDTFLVMGRAEDAGGSDGALVIGWEPSGGAARTLLVPMETVHGTGTALTKLLSREGIACTGVDGIDKSLRQLFAAFHKYKGLSSTLAIHAA